MGSKKPGRGSACSGPMLVSRNRADGFICLTCVTDNVGSPLPIDDAMGKRGERDKGGRGVGAKRGRGEGGMGKGASVGRGGAKPEK